MSLTLKIKFVGESFVKMIVHKQYRAVDGADPGAVAGAVPSVTHFVLGFAGPKLSATRVRSQRP